MNVEERAVWVSRQRQLLRLQGELFLVGILEDANFILKNLSRLLPEDEVNGGSHLLLATSFAKAFGGYFLPSARLSNEDGAEEIFVSEDLRRRFHAALTSYYKAMCRTYVKIHQKLKGLQASSRFHYENRGDLSNKQSNQLQETMESFEKLKNSLQSLADALSVSLPDLGTELETVQVVEGKVIFADPQLTRVEVTSLIYDNEEDRSFYEDLVDLHEMVPELLLTASATATATELDSPKAIGTAPTDETNFVLPTETIDPESVVGKAIDDALSSAEDRSRATQIRAFFEKLPTMRSRSAVDQAATSYAYIHSRAVAKRLADTLIDLPYRRLELLPFISRLLGTLKPHFSEVASMVCTSLIGQFTFLFHHKSPLIGTRSRICRYIGELTKFAVMPQTTTYGLLKRIILDDLTNHNIDMVALLLESCGRYLFHQPESHRRLFNLIEIIRKKERGQGMDSGQIMMLENAIYMCDPSSTPLAEPKPAKPPRLLYLFKLIRHDLNVENSGLILQHLLMFPWSDPDCRQEMMRALLKAWKIKFNCIGALALLIKSLGPYEPAFVEELIDALLEEVRFCLESNQLKYNQRLLSSLRLLGEMLNKELLGVEMIFYTLQLLVLFGHPMGMPRVSAPSDLDPPSGHFRVRGICLLLQTCAPLLRNHPALESFLSLLEYYVATKKSIPLDLEYVLKDTFEELQVMGGLNWKSKGLAETVNALIETQGSHLSFLLDDLEEGHGRQMREGLTVGGGDTSTWWDEDETLSPSQSQISYASTSSYAVGRGDEFDKALSGMVTLGLEERKLERRPAAFDTPIPLGLLSVSGGGAGTLKSAQHPPSPTSSEGVRMLVKKRNKATIKELGMMLPSTKSKTGQATTTSTPVNKVTIQLRGLRRHDV